MGRKSSAYRVNLRRTAAASAAPYGYTLSIWSAGAVSMDVLGRPHAFQALIYAAGAVLGFALVQGAAFASPHVQPVTGKPPVIAAWGNAHWLAVGVAVGAVWVADRVIDSDVGWPVAGFLATGLYLILNALQVTLATVGTDE
jgi:hypothetical protein